MNASKDQGDFYECRKQSIEAKPANDLQLVVRLCWGPAKMVVVEWAREEGGHGKHEERHQISTDLSDMKTDRCIESSSSKRRYAPSCAMAKGQNNLNVQSSNRWFPNAKWGYQLIVAGVYMGWEKVG